MPYALFLVKSNKRLRRTIFRKGRSLDGLENSLKKEKEGNGNLNSTIVFGHGSCCGLALFRIYHRLGWTDLFLKNNWQGWGREKVVYLNPSPLTVLRIHLEQLFLFGDLGKGVFVLRRVSLFWVIKRERRTSGQEAGGTGKHASPSCKLQKKLQLDL